MWDHQASPDQVSWLSNSSGTERAAICESENVFPSIVLMNAAAVGLINAGALGVGGAEESVESRR